MNKQTIPQTDSVEELAQFWDTHDLTDFEDQLEEVTEPVFEQKTVIKIALSSQEVEAVEKIAQIKGINQSELIQEWIFEKINDSSQATQKIITTT